MHCLHPFFWVVDFFWGAPDVAHTQRCCLATSMGKVSFGLVLLLRAPLWMYLSGTTKGHNGPRAISKIMMWV